MSDKQLALDALAKLPESAKLDAIVAHLELLTKIRAGHADADAGRLVPHEQIKREFQTWITE